MTTVMRYISWISIYKVYQPSNCRRSTDRSASNMTSSTTAFIGRTSRAASSKERFSTGQIWRLSNPPSSVSWLFSVVWHTSREKKTRLMWMQRDRHGMKVRWSPLTIHQCQMSLTAECTILAVVFCCFLAGLRHFTVKSPLSLLQLSINFVCHHVTISISISIFIYIRQP